MALDLPDRRSELGRGQLLVREPPGVYHGRVPARVVMLFGRYVRDRAVGEQAVWVIDPYRRVVRIHRGDDAVELVGVDGELRDDTLLPGFALRLSDLFAEIATRAPGGDDGVTPSRER